MALPSPAEKGSSVAFVTALNHARTPRDDNDDDNRPDTSSTCTTPAPASDMESSSRVDVMSRDNWRGRDVKSVEVDLVDYQPLPRSIKMKKIAQRVLNEAPFVSGLSKPMWRAFLTSRPFKELATEGFWFIIAHEILGLSVDAERSPRFSRMAHVYCHMFANAPPVFKDVWGAFFFEAWAITLLILLQESFPKSKPIFDNPSFRMRLLDLCSEWTSGIRPSFPLSGHWVLKFDKRPPTELELLKMRTFGAGLSGSVSTPLLLASGRKDDRIASSCTRREKVPEHRLNYVAARSVIEFGNSPLVQEHLRVLTNGERGSVAPVRLQVTGEATRTLRPFHELVLRLANERTVRSNAWRAEQALREKGAKPAATEILTRIEERREGLLHTHAASKREARKQIARVRADAAEDRRSIQAEAVDLLSKGDVHEFSNFLAQQRAKAKGSSGACGNSMGAGRGIDSSGGSGTPGARSHPSDSGFMDVVACAGRGRTTTPAGRARLRRAHTLTGEST